MDELNEIAENKSVNAMTGSPHSQAHLWLINDAPHKACMVKIITFQTQNH